MALTTLNGVVAGLRPTVFCPKSSASSVIAGRPYTSWYTAGFPSAGTANSSGLAGQALTAPVAGQIPIEYPGGVETVLSQLSVQGFERVSQFWLVDRLWHNSGLVVTSTALQTVNSVAWPARDINSSTDGHGVYIAVENAALSGSGTPTCTMTYTNSDGVAGRVATNLNAITASSPIGSWFVMGLQTGDTGVRSIQDFTLSASLVSGTLVLVAFRPIVILDVCSVTSGDRPLSRVARTLNDAVQLCAPRIKDGSVLQFAGVPGSSSFGATASLGFSQG